MSCVYSVMGGFFFKVGVCLCLCLLDMCMCVCLASSGLCLRYLVVIVIGVFCKNIRSAGSSVEVRMALAHVYLRELNIRGLT